jgi:hypothetical protein
MCLQFGFVNFWQKDFGAKAAHKMLVKLTLGRFNLLDLYCSRQGIGQTKYQDLLNKQHG